MKTMQDFLLYLCTFLNCPKNMKKLLSIIVLGSLIVAVSTSCVTKKKYQELEAQYKECTDDKQFATNELNDCRNQKMDLEKNVADLQAKVDQLKQDTLSLTRKLTQSEKDFARIKNDYDNLARDISRLSTSTSNQISELSTDLDATRAQLNAKEQELNKLQERLKAKEDSLETYMKSLEELQNILNQKDAEVRALKEKVASALKNFEGSGLKVEMRNGKVYVSMDEKLLFASGKWEVQGEGKAAIKELAAVLETESSINVLIEGHTDNVPFNGNGQVKDNWDLSVMRATAVVKLLLASGNIDPQRISASGRGEFFPIDTDNTPAARAKNRRTEIILTPKLDELFQIIDNN